MVQILWRLLLIILIAIDTLVSLVKDGILSIVDAATRANMSVSEFEEKTGLKMA